MQALSVNSKDLFFPVCYTTDQDNRQLRDLANLIHSTRRLAHPCSNTNYNHHATMAPAKWASQTEQLVSRCRQLLISITCEMWITWTSTDWPFHIGRVNTYYRLLLVSQERFGIVYISTPSACYPWHWVPHSSAWRQKRATCRFSEFYSRNIRLTQPCRQLNVQQEPHNGDREVH
jgi:hypothetical protein